MRNNIIFTLAKDQIVSLPFKAASGERRPPLQELENRHDAARRAAYVGNLR